MKRIPKTIYSCLWLLLITLLASCENASPPIVVTATAQTSVGPQVTSTRQPIVLPTATQATPVLTPTTIPSVTPAAKPTRVPTLVRWDVYDPDPQQLWNRLFRQLYGRSSKDGQEYGRDAIDPLLWIGIPSPLETSAYEQVLQILDEFLSTHGERLITDPLKRAMLQHDLWAVFDWLAVGDSWDQLHLAQRHNLQSRLAIVMQRLALAKLQIESLPDNYQTAVRSGTSPTNYQAEHSQISFLPDSLFTPNGDWVLLGREGGPVAMTHVEEAPFFGRSVFLVFIRVPGGRDATWNFFHQLQGRTADAQAGLEVALVRRMLLIDTQGELIASPLVESVQLRHFDSRIEQVFYDFTLSRDRLFTGQTGGLTPVAPGEKEFASFRFNGADFSLMDSKQAEDIKVITLNTCLSCHIDGLQGIVGIRTILSYSRDRFPLMPGPQWPALIQTTPTLEAQATITWKLKHQTWSALKALWPQ
jgi:hypothetical protein